MIKVKQIEQLWRSMVMVFINIEQIQEKGDYFIDNKDLPSLYNMFRMMKNIHSKNNSSNGDVDTCSCKNTTSRQ